MSQQSLSDQWESMGDMGAVAQSNTDQREWDMWSGWTVEWVFQALLAPHRVRASYQEEEALRHFAQVQRGETR